MDKEVEEKARQAFRQFNRFMLLLWQLGLGKFVNMWPEKGGQIMVITHIGRKSGQLRRTPVNYSLSGDDIYCTAGFGQVSDWYRNILIHSEVEVWLPDGWWTGQAEDVTNSPDRLPRMREVLVASGFAAIFAGLDPKTISEEELAAKTETYRLVRIHRTSPRTGPGGPGELSWVWPLATFLLLPLAFRRRPRKRCC